MSNLPARRSPARSDCVTGPAPHGNLRLVQRPTAPRAPGRLAAAAICLGVSLVGCSDAEPRAETDALEGDGFRLGRVHVVLEPSAGDALDDEQLQITARFAFVRGLDEEFVRARIDMPLLPDEILRPTMCTIDDQLRTFEADSGDSSEIRELVLVDAGDLRVHIGDERVQVPLSLVADMLPYMSGVEYHYYGEGPSMADTDGDSVVVEAHGSQTEELPPFVAEGVVPPALHLRLDEGDLLELEQGALVLRWDRADEASANATISVRFTGIVGDDSIGNDITCVFADRGAARIDLQALRTYGLSHAATELRVSASRTHRGTFDAGDFTGSELVVERRSHLAIPL